MTQHGHMRRIGWFAILAVCATLYLMLHLRVQAVKSDVIRAERQIVALEQQKLFLETEFETRANQLQLAAWNNVDFGYTAPTASQFLQNERQLAGFGSPRAPGAPEPIRIAGNTGDEPEFDEIVSPLTGKPVEQALLEPEGARAGTLTNARIAGDGRLADGSMRIPLGAVIGSATQ